MITVVEKVRFYETDMMGDVCWSSATNRIYCLWFRWT